MKHPFRFVAPFASLAVLSFGAVLFAQQEANRLANPDAVFLTRAAQGGLAEVQLGQLATQNAENPAVKAFGQRMVDDHTKLNDQLRQIAAQQNLALPTSMDSKQQATFDRLSRLHGAAFDRAYMANMVQDHKSDIVDFERQANSGNDPALKRFAETSLPMLREHLRLGEETQAKVSARG